MSLDYIMNNYKLCKFQIYIYGLELYKIKSLYPSNVLHLYWRANEINEFSARVRTKNVRYLDQKINDSHHMFSNIFSFNFGYKKILNTFLVVFCTPAVFHICFIIPTKIIYEIDFRLPCLVWSNQIYIIQIESNGNQYTFGYIWINILVNSL